MPRRIKEDAQISSTLGNIPLGASSPDMSKDYVAPNFGVKDIQVAKPKYKKYKSIKKKVKEDIYSFDGETSLRDGKPIKIEPISEFKAGLCNVEFSINGEYFVRINGKPKESVWTYFSEKNIEKHPLRYLLLHTIAQYVLKVEIPFNLDASQILNKREFQNEIFKNYAIDLDPSDFIVSLKPNESKIKTLISGTSRRVIFKYVMKVMRSNYDPVDRLVANKRDREENGKNGNEYGKIGKGISDKIIPKDQRIYTVPPEEKLKRRSYE